MYLCLCGYVNVSRIHTEDRGVAFPGAEITGNYLRVLRAKLRSPGRSAHVLQR